MTERASGWLKFLMMLAPFALAFLVGWGSLNAKVTMIRETQLNVLETKADKATVNAQYSEILRRLDRLTDQMDRHIERTGR